MLLSISFMIINIYRVNTYFFMIETSMFQVQNFNFFLIIIIQVQNKDIIFLTNVTYITFFNKKREQEIYFNLLKRLVKKNGFVIIAAFHLKGAPKCCGLPVHRYDVGMLHGRLGNDFALIESFDHTYVMPSGDHREYVYALFKRNNS